MKAVWNDTVIAESDDTIVVEGNHYFPPEAVNQDLMTASGHTSNCPWKGKADYLSIDAGGQVNENAAWFYADPLEKAVELKNYVAFWNGVEVS